MILDSQRYPDNFTRALAGLRVLTAFALLLICVPSFAIDRDLKLDQLSHTAWTIRDGAPANIHGLATTSDGVLWVGAAEGLYRFDGKSFRKFQPYGGDPLAGNAVQAMLGDADGGLWAGFVCGGVSHILSGVVKSFGEADGLPGGETKAFTRDRHGVVWVLTAEGIARFNGVRWERHGTDWNLTEDCSAIFSDHNGTLWVGTKYTLRYLVEGGNQFHIAADHLKSVTSIGESPGGTLWIAEANLAVRSAPLSQVAEQRTGTQIDVGSDELLFDKQGSLWITTLGDGLRRIRYADSVRKSRVGEFDNTAEIYTHKDGLSHDFETCILEDREGNIWIASHDGLDRFRQTPLVPVSFPSGSSHFSLARGSSGEILVGTSNRSLFRIDKDEVRSLGVASGASSEYAAPDGSVWLVWLDSVGRFKDNHLERIAAPPGTSLLHAYAMTVDNSGALWVSFADYGIFRYSQGKWLSSHDLGGPDDTALSILTDGAGRLWFGYADSSIRVLEHGKVREFAGKNHGPVGEVRSMGGRNGDLFIGGDRGLGFLVGDAFRPVLPNDRESFTQVSGLIETKENGLWFCENRGIVHINQAEVNLLRLHPDHKVFYQTLSYLDGLPSPLAIPRVMSSSVQGNDDRLWFATTDGVVWIHERGTQRLIQPPDVSIEGVEASGEQHSPKAFVHLPAHTRSIQIEYTAWNLSVPERTQFRYRLEGLGQNWQEVGDERQAIFMGLNPGRYSFDVVARIGDGDWSKTAAVVQFDIAPAWYQTRLFQSMCAVIFLSSLYMIYSLRLRYATSQIKMLMRERVHERERIARELHDTLLQGFQGLMLRLQAVMSGIPKELSARSDMEKVLDRADEVLIEGRNRVLDLRAESITADGFAEALSAFADDFGINYTASFTITVEPTSKVLNPIILDEACRIGREAIANAFRHSNGRNIICTVEFDALRVRMSIQDDGQGISPEIIKSGKDGHWGIPGMRERTRNISGQLCICSDSGNGTEVVLTIPAELAYSKDSLRIGWAWVKRLLNRET